MLFRFKPTYPISLTKLTLAFPWLMDWLPKCDDVVTLMVIKVIPPSKNTLFLSSKSKNVPETITRSNITKNNY